MDYTRTYWLLFLGAGLLFLLLAALDYLAAGTVTLGIGGSILVGLAVVTITAYASVYPDRAGGPTEPNLRFGLALAAFVLFLGLAVVRLLGL